MNEEEVKQKAKKCKELSMKIVDIFKEDETDFDIALSVLCQLYTKIGLDFDVSPFGLINAVSTALQMHIEVEDEAENNEPPPVHWSPNGTQFH
jgi:hypothetical protein